MPVNYNSNAKTKVVCKINNKKINMKQRMKFFVAVVCIASGIGYWTTYKTSHEAVSDLALENIEALASGEGATGNVACAYPGSIDCFGNKVKYRIEGFSLD